MVSTASSKRGDRVSVARDDRPVGHVVRAGASWTAFVYTAEAPFDTTRTGFASSQAAVAFTAKNGVTPGHLA